MHSTSTHSAQGVGSRWYCTVDMGSTPFFILLPAFFCESCACVGAWRVRCESEWRSALSASRAHGRTHTFSFRFTVWSVDSGDRRHSHMHGAMHIFLFARYSTVSGYSVSQTFALQSTGVSPSSAHTYRQPSRIRSRVSITPAGPHRARTAVAARAGALSRGHIKHLTAMRTARDTAALVSITRAGKLRRKRHTQG